GLTVGCARCHDHKFDPIAQSGYYALYAILAGVHHGQREVTTAEQRQQRAEQLGTLKRARDELPGRIDGLRNSIHERAEKQAANIERQWNRPQIDRTLTEETFPPTEAKFVRLVVEGTENDPAANRGHRIDEFEVWTSGRGGRNVAL